MLRMLNVAEVQGLVRALAPRVVGGVVQGVRQLDAETVVLEVRVPGRTTHLLVSARPGAARLSERPDPGPGGWDTPRTMTQWLRAQAKGRVITGLQVVGHDRVVRLDFEGGTLVGLLFGRRPTLVGLEASGRVACVAGAPHEGATPGQPFEWPAPRGADEACAPVVDIDPVAFEAAWLADERAAAWAREARGLRGAVARATHRTEALLQNLATDAARHADFDRWRTLGEALRGVASRTPRGATHARVVDYSSPTLEEVDVPLDPTLDGAGNVARLFQRYRKGRDAQAKLAERVRAAEARFAALVELAAELEQRVAESEPHLDLAALEVLRAQLDARLRRLGGGPVPRAQAPGKAAAPPPERLPYRTFTSQAGETILVGRGGADNHALTFRVARGNDVWLHARDSPGAHVVVPQPTRGRAPQRETLLDAAALALHHSDLRGEPVGDVTCVARKHVRAIRGAAPGRVSLADASAITVHDAPVRVARLYADRAEGPA